MNKNTLTPTVAIIVVVILAIAGYMYYQSIQMTDDHYEDNPEQEVSTVTGDNTQNKGETELSTADTTDAIDTDLDNIDLGNLDAEFGDIDADIDTL